jgi:hypothetical protein
MLDAHQVPGGLRQGRELPPQSRLSGDMAVVHLRFGIDIVRIGADRQSLSQSLLIAAAPPFRDRVGILGHRRNDDMLVVRGDARPGQY